MESSTEGSCLRRPSFPDCWNLTLHGTATTWEEHRLQRGCATRHTSLACATFSLKLFFSPRIPCRTPHDIMFSCLLASFGCDSVSDFLFFMTLTVLRSTSQGRGNGNPLQCSCLENPRDGRAWWATVYGVAQSRTQLKRLSSSSQGRGVQDGGTHVHPLLIHVNLWQKPPQYCKVISLQLKLKKKKRSTSQVFCRMSRHLGLCDVFSWLEWSYNFGRKTTEAKCHPQYMDKKGTRSQCDFPLMISTLKTRLGY